MNVADLNPTRDDLADAADLALTHLAQQVPDGYRLELVSTLRPAIRALRHGSNDCSLALHWADTFAPGERGLELRRALIAFSVEVQR